MRQYHSLKQQVPNALLLFRLGDFYELFYEDAVVAARELEITLTSRSKDREIPMCGVPHHAAEGYIARLVQRGYRVAICEQTEDPRFTKKLVTREIQRVITPGTATASGVLRARENNYLAGAIFAKTHAGVALVDLSTGEFQVTELAATDVPALLESLNVREVLSADASLEFGGILRTPVEPWIFENEYADRILREHFKLLTLDGCGLAAKPLACAAAGAVLHYLRDTQKSSLEHLGIPAYFDRAAYMVLDAVTVRNLELTEPLYAGERKDSTLISVLDQTSTGMGGRLLRARLLRPSLDEAEIVARLDAVQHFVEGIIERTQVRSALDRIADLERLLAKVTLNSATPREMLALARSLSLISEVRFTSGESHLLIDLALRLDPVSDVSEKLMKALSEEPPVNLNDGGTIRDGFHQELDELRSISRNSKQFIASIETRERTRTGIASLKVRFNNVFGYYIEISKANADSAPADYERKQTLVNAERFTTPELKVLEEKVLTAEEKMLNIEREVFAELRVFAAQHSGRIRATAAAVAELDVVATLAHVAVANRYQRPRFSANNELRVAGGRHPVIENLTRQEASRFIANDLYLDSDQFIAVITGPNMGGKSTYLRQAALLSILAQIGSFVPADAAVLPIVDRVFTRIGAADNLARGRSTFMVEMTETAVILNTATERSLVILDEIGRGTATYDGLALAWAVIEHLHDRIKAKTLFATHYHELTVLAGQLAGVRNLQVAVKAAGDQIIFLRRVEPGAASRSYGIEVARLAAIPAPVIERARQVLALHEKSEVAVTEELTPSVRETPVQIRLFEPLSHNVAERIRGLNLNELRPLDALTLLAELQDELQGERRQ